MNLKFISKKIRILLHGDTRPLLFDHIPKCAGSTVREFLFSQYPREQTWEFKGGSRQMIVDEFLSLTEEHRSSLRLILGHGAHHIEQLLPETFFKAVMFRDPIDRIVSHYHYVKRRPEHHLHKAVQTQEMSLEDYATSGISNELGNFYTCHILDCEPKTVIDKPEASAKDALDRVVESYDLIQTLDHMDSFMESLASQCNLRKSRIPEKPANVTKDRTPLDAIKQQTKDLIASENQADVIFYKLLKAHLGSLRETQT